MTRTLCLTVIALTMTACATSEPVRTPASPAAPATSVATDPHSYANTTAFGTRHFELDLDVDFDRRVLSGHVVLQLDRRDKSQPCVQVLTSAPRVEPFAGSLHQGESAQFQ